MMADEVRWALRPNNTARPTRETALTSWRARKKYSWSVHFPKVGRSEKLLADMLKKWGRVVAGLELVP
jgi:hypothetical protein